MWKNGGCGDGRQLLPDQAARDTRSKAGRSARAETRAASRRRQRTVSTRSVLCMCANVCCSGISATWNRAAYAASARSCAGVMPSSGAGSGSVRADEDVLHVRRVAVHLERGDRADSLFEVPHRRQRSARDVVGEDAPAQRRRVFDRARTASSIVSGGAYRQLRERHRAVKRAVRIGAFDRARDRRER